MKKLVVVFGLFMCVSVTSQNTMSKCVVTSSDGVTIEGFFQNFTIATTIEKGFKLWSHDGQKTKISPKNHTLVTIGNIEFRSINNNNGKPRFMRFMVDGPKAELYLETINRMVGSGMTTQMYIVNEYYLKKGDKVQYMDPNTLKTYPQVFFSGDDVLCETVKNTKKKNFTIPAWVEAYNKIESTRN
jgi:hypothetical protein